MSLPAVNARLRDLKRRAIAVVFLALVACGERTRCGCRFIRREATQIATARVPEAMIQREVARAMATDAATATAMCGVAATGLTSVTASRDASIPELLGRGSARVRGTSVGTP